MALTAFSTRPLGLDPNKPGNPAIPITGGNPAFRAGGNPAFGAGGNPAFGAGGLPKATSPFATMGGGMPSAMPQANMGGALSGQAPKGTQENRSAANRPIASLSPEDPNFQKYKGLRSSGQGVLAKARESLMNSYVPTSTISGV